MEFRFVLYAGNVWNEKEAQTKMSKSVCGDLLMSERDGICTLLGIL